MASQPCHLKPEVFDRGGLMDLDRMKAIEIHIPDDRYCLHPPLSELVLKGNLNNTTPLLMACAEGDLIVVERIVEFWGVDVNAAATYCHLMHGSGTNPTWHQEMLGATPLFVAAINGHDLVVRYLLGKGANISAKTTGLGYGGMNPLHGALTFIFHQPVSSPLREKKTAVVRTLLEFGADPASLRGNCEPNWTANLYTTAIIALIDSGTSLKQLCYYNDKDDTDMLTLHHWLYPPDPLQSRKEEEYQLVIAKLLFKKGAALLALEENGFSSILCAANEFQTQTSRENLSILDFFLEQDAIDRREKIDALEVIGAVILSDPANAHLFKTAFDYWRQAMHLRQLETEQSTQPLPKTVMKRKEGLTVEWSTSNELEQVVARPSEYLLQAFLIRLRIYSNKSWEAVEYFVIDFLKNTLATLKEKRKFAELSLNILWAILEMIVSFQPIDEPIDRKDTWGTSSWTVKEIVKILSNLEKGDHLLRTQTIKTSLELILSAETVQKMPTGNGLNLRYYRALLKLITMLSRHPEMLNEENKQILEELVQLKRRAFHGLTLLHVACYDTPTDFDTVCLLIKSGNDVNAGDSYMNNGPLHLFFLLYTGEADEKWYAIARLLIESGAHLDRVNKDGQTAAEFWTENRNILKCNKDRLPDWCYETLPSRLMCLSSRVIRSNKIYYTEETLPIYLHKFVAMH